MGSQLECSNIKFQQNEGHHLKLGELKTCYLEHLVESPLLYNYILNYLCLPTFWGRGDFEIIFTAKAHFYQGFSKL